MHQFVKIIFILVLSLTTQSITIFSSLQLNAESKDSIILAGGCFWCVEADFEKVNGISEVISGYTGGYVKNPTYKQVVKGLTGHYEAVIIYFDPKLITVENILSKFFRSIDPTDSGGQFCDRGHSYKSAVFARPSQILIAENALLQAEAVLGETIVTPILEVSEFFIAEDYHQDYYKGENLVLTRFGPIKQKKAYKRYRSACGRDKRLKQLWGKDAFLN
jgi:peptide-methionine (S)-S-oxide reductase|tara:strand:- start:4594 stop:5250 length:657 start_codon:yes stop_codon:yes gene_type:complete